MGTGPTIRLAEETDAPAVRAIYAPFVTDSVTSFETDPPTADEMATRIVDTVERFPWLVCVLDGAVAGYAYAGPYRSRDAYQWSVEVSVYVHDAHRRAGVGRALYESLFAALRIQGFLNAYAVVTLPNPTSVGFHESLGFEHTGTDHAVGHKHGAWHDVGRWERPLGDHPVDPDPPRAIEAVRGSADWERALAVGLDSLTLDD